MKITENSKKIINSEIYKYYGNRIYETYHPRAVTGEEVDKLRGLIYTIIEKINKEEK